MQLNDATRRGLRTAIDVILSAISSGLLLLLVNVFKEPDLTLAQFSTLTATLTPVLSVIKNAIEDKVERSLLVSKQRPEPDPVKPEETPLIQPTEQEIFGDAVGDPLSPPLADQQVIFGQVPSGHVLLAVAPEDVEEGDEVVGFVR